MGLKIAIDHVDESGQKGIHPETMKLLLDLGKHRRECFLCDTACRGITSIMCPTGVKLLTELCARPDVSNHEDETKSGMN